jgi:hypothetical protein
MAKILDFEKAHEAKQRNEQIEKVMGGLVAAHDKVGSVIREFRELIQRDALAAISRLPEYIYKARNVTDRIHESMCGGPNQDWVGPILSAIGDVYSLFEKNERSQILRICMDYLDSCNYFNAQDHVALIDDPWLVSDIVITRPLYWPGYKRYANLLEENKIWKEVQEKMSEVRSAFWMAFAVSMKKGPSDNVRGNFYRTFPGLMDKTMDGIAAITAEHAASEAKIEGSDLENNIQERLFKYDPGLVPRVRKKIKEAKWIRMDEKY